jgi:hypothetical protein
MHSFSAEQVADFSLWTSFILWLNVEPFTGRVYAFFADCSYALKVTPAESKGELKQLSRRKSIALSLSLVPCGMPQQSRQPPDGQRFFDSRPSDAACFAALRH